MVYRGIVTRYRLEATFASWLDTIGCAWRHEPPCFAGRGDGVLDGDQWLPDFEVLPQGNGPPMFVEVKPLSAFTAEALDDWTRRMAVAWESRPEALLRLWFEGRRSTARRPSGAASSSQIGEDVDVLTQIHEVGSAVLSVRGLRE